MSNMRSNIVVWIMGRYQIENKQYTEEIFNNHPHIIISITDPSIKNRLKNNRGYRLPPEIITDNTRDILYLQFHDLEEGYPIESYIISYSQARQIIDIVEHNQNDISYIVVHCEAGISRSAGTALALQEIYGYEIKTDNLFNPNDTVKERILKYYRDIHTV